MIIICSVFFGRALSMRYYISHYENYCSTYPYYTFVNGFSGF